MLHILLFFCFVFGGELKLGLFAAPLKLSNALCCLRTFFFCRLVGVGDEEKGLMDSHRERHCNIVVIEWVRGVTMGIGKQLSYLHISA